MPGNDNMDNMTDTGPTAQELDEERQEIKRLAAAATTAVQAVNDEATEAQVTAADNALTALKSAIDGASDALEGDPEVSRAQGNHETLTTTLEVAKTSRQTAMETARAEMEKAAAERRNSLARALKAGIDTDLDRGRVESTVTTEGRPYLNPTTNVLGIHPTLGVRDANLPVTLAHTELKLDASTTVAALGDWQGAQYVKTDSDGMVTDTAVIYTNQGPPKRELFATKHAATLNNGRIPHANLAALMPMSNEFQTTPGTKTHELAEGVTVGDITLRGTLDGAPGQFRCPSTATTCTSQGGPDKTTILGEGWYFIADANAMTSTPSTTYSAFGWWLNEDGDNKRADGFWFVSRLAGGNTASVDGILIDDDAAAITAVQNLRGTATYRGHAAGKVGFYDAVLGSQNVGGHFTADATLTADFQGELGGSESWGTMTGTLDGFMVDGVAVNDWEVKLLSERQSGDFRESNISGFTSEPNRGVVYSGVTTWSIDGKTANDQEGKHYGVFLDAHEDSGLPLTTVGNFTAQYGSIGSMTGGFGATTTDADD